MDKKNDLCRHYYKMLLLFALCSLATLTQAGELALQINGLSYHPHTNTHYNETNSGLGLQYSKYAQDGGSYEFLAGGWLKNSVGHTMPYAGGGVAKHFGGERLYSDISLFVFAGQYPGYHQTTTFIAPLPVLSIGSGAIAVNLMYVPKIADVEDAAYFAQLKITLGKIGSRYAW